MTEKHALDCPEFVEQRLLETSYTGDLFFGSEASLQWGGPLEGAPEERGKDGFGG